MPDKEYNQEEQEYMIHRQELKYLMDKYPEDFKDWNDEEEPYSFFDVLKDTAKMGGMAGIIGLEKIGVNTGPIIQKARKYFNEGGIVEEKSFWDKFNPLTGSYRKETPISVKAAEVVAENAPITGSAYTAADISDELDKEDPSKLKIAGLMGAEVLGAVPFVGDAAQSLIRKGLKAKGYGEASDETVGLMREKYPNMQAREETYRIAERPDPKTGETDIKVGPEQELEEVPTYPEAPERSSVFIDPSRARVEYDGEYRNTVIPTKGALYIEDIVEQSDGVLYRGMSAEEYRGALEQGYIKSKGDYNIGDEQEGLTFFSTRPSQAQSYANNFTPEGFKATPDRPAYVVAIKKPNKIDYVTGDTEIGLKGEIPTSAIVDVFEGKPYQFKSDVVVQTDFGNTKNVYGSPDTALVTWERIDNASSSISVDKTSDMSVLVKDAPTNAIDDIGLTEEAREEWRKVNKVNQKQTRVPQVQQAAKGLMKKEITSAEYRELVEGFQPISLLEEVPTLPTVEDIASALNSDKVRKGIVGVNKGIEDGTYVASRLDIPAYEQYDTWVVSVHDGAGGKLNGESVGYAQTAVLKDVTFNSVPKAAANIASGKNKTTIARIFGNWENQDPQEVYARAVSLMDDPEWTQVGMNPFRHSYFYDKVTGEPVVAATEVVQVGPLVLAKNVTKASPDDPKFRISAKDENSPTFALGGLATARKGITTEEGKEMADKRFQLDEKKADLNNDNKLSDYEKQRGETVQKAMKMYHGGMPCGCEGGDDCDCGGGMMSDPVSGNPIPIGSSAENVRDDIEAMISEGEYVLPANVVKWHGLKHIMDMQSEAEMGLMGMYDMGLIQYAGEEAEDPEQESEAEEDVPSEDVEVEVATVEVDDMLDDEEDGEISPTTSNLPGMVSKPKLMIMS